jgi:D-3-phosphoglycerate dehydrogenase
MNKIAEIGLKRLDSAQFAISDSEPSPTGMLVRSANMNDMELPESLLAIARAGAGVNNIPVAACADKGIVVFNTPGANANAVRELAVCALFLSSRDIVEGIEWARKLEGDVPALVEKGKSQFAGPEIMGKNLGVVGLGAIGVGVANAGHHLGMNVIGYDPYISVDAAWGLSRSVKNCHDLKQMLAECDYISLHVPLNVKTRGMFNAEMFSLLKDGVRILNFARAELINDADLLSALDSGKVAKYVTDFPNAAVLVHKNVLPIPHLGASTPESEDNCAVMAVDELRDYLLNGNIKNSVNFPDVSLPPCGDCVRLCVIHKNIPNMIATITAFFGEQGINIEDMVNKSKGEYQYTMLNVSSIGDGIAEKLLAVDGIIKVRVLKN